MRANIRIFSDTTKQKSRNLRFKASFYGLSSIFDTCTHKKAPLDSEALFMSMMYDRQAFVTYI